MAKAAATKTAPGAIPGKQLTISVQRDSSSEFPNILSTEIGDRVAYFSGGGGRGRLYATSDGKTLHRRHAPERGLRGVRVIGDELWITGEYGTTSVSRDRGASWEAIDNPSHSCIWDIVRDPKGVLWAAGSDAVLLKATKSGQPFKAVAHKKKPRDERADPRVELVPVGVMFMVFGAYWNGKELVKPRGLTGQVSALAIAPSGTIVMVGDDGKAFRSTDGGASYKPVVTGTSAHLEDVGFVAGGFIAVGAKGTMRRSEDDGVTWKPLGSGTKLDLWSIGSWGTGAFVGGQEGLILRIAAPDDTYWKGAVDDFAPKPVVRADVTPLRAAAKKDRDARHAKLLAEAQTAQAAHAKKLASPKVPFDAHEKSILAAIDDVDEYKVLGDALQAANDPRGELIALQAADQKKPAASLLKKHAAALQGVLADVPENLEVKAGWRWGFLHEARVALHPDFDGDEDDDDDDDDEDEDDEEDTGASKAVPVPTFVASLLDDAPARFLQKLTVGLVTRWDNDYSNVIREIGRRPRPALRELFLGDFDSEETEMSWSAMGDVTKLCGALERLERLTLSSGSMQLGKPGQLAFPSLKSLRIVTGGLDKSDLKAVESAHMPSLESLVLYFGTSRYGGNVTAKDLRTLLASDRFPRLARLGLVNAEIVDELCKVLHTSPLVAQIEELDLSMGTLSDEGARALATYAGGLAHLKTLDCSRSYLSSQGIKMLTKAFPNAKVDTRNQRGSDEFSRRYVSISE